MQEKGPTDASVRQLQTLLFPFRLMQEKNSRKFFPFFNSHTEWNALLLNFYMNIFFSLIGPILYVFWHFTVLVWQALYVPNNRCPHCQGHKERNWKLLGNIEVDTMIIPCPLLSLTNHRIPEPGSRDSFFIHFHLNLFCPRWSQIPGLKNPFKRV